MATRSIVSLFTKLIDSQEQVTQLQSGDMVHFNLEGPVVTVSITRQGEQLNFGDYSSLELEGVPSSTSDYHSIRVLVQLIEALTSLESEACESRPGTHAFRFTSS